MYAPSWLHDCETRSSLLFYLLISAAFYYQMDWNSRKLTVFTNRMYGLGVIYIISSEILADFVTRYFDQLSSMWKSIQTIDVIYPF